MTSTSMSCLYPLKSHRGSRSSVSKPAAASASSTGRADSGRTKKSMSWVDRGRPKAAEPIPPMRTYGMPAPSTAATASDSTDRR